MDPVLEAENAESLRLVDETSRHAAAAKRLTSELRALDPHLEVVFVGSPRIDDWEMPPGIARNRWHVVRHNPGTVDSWFPIMGPEGEYQEPSEKVVRDMKRADLWRAGALKELRDRQYQEARRAERERALATEQRIDHGAEAFRAAKRTAGEGGMTRRKWGKG